MKKKAIGDTERIYRENIENIYREKKEHTESNERLESE